MSTAIAFDTLKFAVTLRDAGVPAQQAEAQARAFAEIFQVNLDQLVTKEEFESFRAFVASEFEVTRKEFKAEIEAARKDFKAEIESARKEFKGDLDSARKESKSDFETARREAKADLAKLEESSLRRGRTSVDPN